MASKTESSASISGSPFEELGESNVPSAGGPQVQAPRPPVRNAHSKRPPRVLQSRALRQPGHPRHRTGSRGRHARSKRCTFRFTLVHLVSIELITSSSRLDDATLTNDDH